MRHPFAKAPPYMCFGSGVSSFELPHLIFGEDVILIDPLVVGVRIARPFNQILQAFAPAKQS